MKWDPATPYFPYFAVAWLLLGGGSWLWMRSRPTVEEKRRWHLRVMVGSNVIFGLFATLVFISWGQFGPMLIVLPFLALITYLNLRFTFFCDSCGKMSRSQEWFSSTYHCPHCGHKLR